MGGMLKRSASMEVRLSMPAPRAWACRALGPNWRGDCCDTLLRREFLFEVQWHMSTAEIEWRSVIDAPWIEMSPARIGAIPSGLGTPDQYILITGSDGQRLRVDAYASSEELFTFNDAKMVGGHLGVGWGHSVYFINCTTREVTSHALAAYFHEMRATSDSLLVTSGERVFRFATDGSLLWRTDPVGVDGVIIDTVENSVIQGQGEWDPPGGWKRFQVHLDSGQLV